MNAYEVSRVFYKDLGPDRTYGRVLERLGTKKTDVSSARWKYLQGQVGKLIHEWESSGKIDHTVRRDDPMFDGYFERLPSLEDRLRSRFMLRAAVVVRDSDLFPRVEIERDDEPWARYDLSIQQGLGKWASRILMSLVRPNDVVGVGPGRATYFTAEQCSSTRIGSQPTTVKALAGYMTRHMLVGRPGDETSAIGLDANDVASLLAGRLGTKDLKRVQQPLANANIVSKLSTDDVDIAVVGIGNYTPWNSKSPSSFHQKTRFYQHESSNELKEILKILENVKKRIQKVEKKPPTGRGPFYHLIGDICGWFFLADGPIAQQRFGLPKKTRESIQSAIDDLNGRLLNTSIENLTSVAESRGGVLAVCGGPDKLCALDHILSRGRIGSPIISHLITCQSNATELLELGTL